MRIQEQNKKEILILIVEKRWTKDLSCPSKTALTAVHFWRSHTGETVNLKKQKPSKDREGWENGKRMSSKLYDVLRKPFRIG